MCKHPPVANRSWIPVVLGSAAIVLDLAGEAAEAFGPLKAVLGVISTAYSHYKVRSQPLSQNVSLTSYSQKTVAVGNKVNDLLSRIAVLEALFAESPGDVAEEKRRHELLWYYIVPHSGPALIFIQQARRDCETIEAVR